MRLVRLLSAIAALLLAAVFLSGCGEEQARADSPPRATTTKSTPPTTVDPWNVTPTQPVYHPTPVTLQAPDPARIDIPAVGIASDLVPLGFNPDGSMQVPKHYSQAGWFADGPNPGETGPAVIAGHIDSTRGPAVFYRLKDLQAGNDIVVTRVDATTAVFRVTRVETYEKHAFPTASVFGPTPGVELRLVTCGGDFDWSKHTYKSNVVVYATLV